MEAGICSQSVLTKREPLVDVRVTNFAQIFKRLTGSSGDRCRIIQPPIYKIQ
jgi:hypothetical protein